MKMTNTDRLGEDVPVLLLRLDDADQRERRRLHHDRDGRRAPAAARRRSAARPRAARRSARTCSRWPSPAIRTPITETDVMRQHEEDADVEVLGPDRVRRTGSRRTARCTGPARRPARARTPRSPRRRGIMSSFWTNFTPSATSCAQPWNRPAYIGPSARLHVRQHLVLHVADAERRRQEEDQHDRRLHDQDHPVLVEPLVHEALAGRATRSLLLLLLALDRARPRLGLSGHEREVLAQRVALELLGEQQLHQVAGAPRTRSRTSPTVSRSHQFAPGQMSEIVGSTISSAGSRTFTRTLWLCVVEYRWVTTSNPVLAEVHGGGEVEVVAVELGLVAQERHELAVPGRGHRDHAVAVLLLEGHDVVTELRAQARFDLSRRKRVS